MSDAWRDWEGQVVDGKFALRRHLGGTDHSVIFLTERQDGQPQKAAIKFIQVDAANTEAQFSRWKHAAQLSHPNLLKLFDTGRCQLAGMDLLYVVTECAEESLAQFLPQRALSPIETQDMLAPLLETLTYLHSNGLVHGHIKPSNILAIDDQLKLSCDTLSRLGESSTAIGKPDAYTPPEAATEKISPAADVWSLGVTLVEAMTQRVPDGSAPSAKEDPRLPDSLPQPFSDIALNCLRRDPKRRWSIAQISHRLNPPAEPLSAATAAAAATSATADASSATAAPAQPAPAEANSATETKSPTETESTPLILETAAADAPPPKPPTFVDPLSVPLSSLSPLGKKSALQNQTIPGKSSSKAYYIVIAVVLALVLAAILGVPRLLDRGGQTNATSPVATGPVNPSAPPASNPSSNQPQANQAPGNLAKSEKSASSPADKPAQRAAQDSSQALSSAAEKKSTDKNLSAAEEAASLRSPFPHTARPAAAPFVPNRDASIAAGAVTPGEVLTQVMPEISDKSRSTIRGTVKVIVKVRVDTSGNVSTAELAATGPSRFFADAALTAARRWDFAPAKVDGHAVPSEWLLHFNFTPTDTTVTPLPTKP